MSVTNSLQRFFAEQEDRMNVADEEIDSYLSRIASANRTRANRGPSVRTSPVSDYGGITPQPYEYDREKQGISNETSDSVEYLETTISALHAGISSVMEGPEPNASVSCTKRKMSDPTSESRPEKKSRADHDEPLHISAIDETAVSAASNGRQSRAESSLASKQQGRISPHPGRPAMDGPVDKELGRSKGTSQVGLAAAVSVSNGDDADTTKQRVSHGSLNPSHVPVTPAGDSQSATRKKINGSREIKPEARADTSNITTPSNSMVVSVKKGTAQLSDKTATKKAIPLTQATTKKKASKKKEKILVTQLEHAHALLKEREARGPDWKPRINYLTGMRIYFYGGDLNYAGEGTRNKMRILVDRGATLLPTYDPETTTHIITNASKGTFLEAIGLRSLKDIPEHIPVLKWEWIISHRNGEMGKWYDYASFRQRVHWVNANGDYELFKGANQAKSVKGKEIEKPDTSKRAESEDAAEFSRISSFTQDKPAASRKELASHGPSASSSSAVVSGPNATVTMGERKDEDPLAAFYERARAELEAEELQGESDGNASDDERRGGSSSVTALKRGDNGSVQKGKSMFACDRKGEQPSDQKCPNQDVIDKLEELKALHDAKPSDGDHWRVFSYNKAVRALRSYPTRIRSYDEARKLFGVGDKTAQKIMEIIETGQLQRIQYERTEDIEITKLFTGIYGVGRSTAYKWYQNGCRTLEDLKNGKAGVKLSASQRIGIQFYDDINARMPRDEARQIFELIKPLALEIDPKLFVEIMGSYRRGKADCGDIDILITRPTDDGKTHSGVLKKLLAKCHERGIVTEDLNLPDDWMDLENCYRGLCRRDENSRRRRIDFLTVPYESRGAALLYYTGDDIFNRSMRMKANMMGYSLNQKGLYSGVVRNPSNRREKLNDGTIIASATEEEIFKVLGVPWHEPHERVRNRA